MNTIYKKGKTTASRITIRLSVLQEEFYQTSRTSENVELTREYLLKIK
nr:hypothetical protein [uncultured Flavobacterium sp.]